MVGSVTGIAQTSSWIAGLAGSRSEDIATTGTTQKAVQAKRPRRHRSMALIPLAFITPDHRDPNASLAAHRRVDLNQGALDPSSGIGERDDDRPEDGQQYVADCIGHSDSEDRSLAVSSFAAACNSRIDRHRSGERATDDHRIEAQDP